MTINFKRNGIRKSAELTSPGVFDLFEHRNGKKIYVATVTQSSCPYSLRKLLYNQELEEGDFIEQ